MRQNLNGINEMEISNMNKMLFLFFFPLVLLGCNKDRNNNGFSYTNTILEPEKLVQHKFQLGEMNLKLLAPNGLSVRSVSNVVDDQAIIKMRSKGGNDGVDILVDFRNRNISLGDFGNDSGFQLLKKNEKDSQQYWDLRRVSGHSHQLKRNSLK